MDQNDRPPAGNANANANANADADAETNAGTNADAKNRIDFDLLKDWLRDNRRDTAADPRKMIEWMRSVKPKRVYYIRAFVQWREISFFAQAFEDLFSKRTEQAVRENAERLVKENGVSEQRLKTILDEVPKAHRDGFLEFLAWMVSSLGQAQDADEVDPLLLFIAYGVLVRNARATDLMTLGDAERGMLFGTAVLPFTVLRALGLLNASQDVSDRYMDRQIRALERFTDPNPDTSDPYEWFMRDPNSDEALRALLLSHANRVNSALSKISSGVTQPSQEEARFWQENGVQPVITIVESDDKKEFYDSRDGFLRLFVGQFVSGGKDIKAVFRGHEDDLFVVLQALIDLMLVFGAVATAQDEQYMDSFVKPLFQTVVKIVDGNFPDLPRLRAMYRDMIKNPFVEYGDEHRLEGIGAGKDVGQLLSNVRPVPWDAAFGGQYGMLLDRIKSVALQGDQHVPKGDFEKEAVRLVESMMDPAQMFDPVSSLLGTALTYELQPGTINGMFTADQDDPAVAAQPLASQITLKKGTILAIHVENFRSIAARSPDFQVKTVKLRWKTSPAGGGGSKEDAEFELIREDGGYDASDERIDEKGLLTLDDVDSDIVFSGKDGNGLNNSLEIVVDRNDSIVSEAREYLRWVVDGEPGSPPSSGTSKRLTAARTFVEREESKKLAAEPLLALVEEIRNAVLEKIQPRNGPRAPVDLRRFANREAFRQGQIDSRRREAAIFDANARANAVTEGRDYVSTYREEVGEIESSDRARRAEEGRMRRIASKGRKALDALATKTGTAVNRLINNDLMTATVHRSPVCAPDGTEPTELQKLMKTAADNADDYLSKQYQMFGLWGLFNLMLIAVMFYLLYKIWEILFQYYQFRRQASKSVGTPSSNNIFDPADDDDDWRPKAADLAKRRVPSGAAIESRLRRYSKEAGMDLSEAIDRSKDKYPKEARDDGDDDDDY